MYFLLPNQFKVIGAIIAPVGFCIWLTMQFGYISKALACIFGKNVNPYTYHTINVSMAIISFFAFLFGIYFMIFSKEEIEDEMIEKTRLNCFQFAAQIQIIGVLFGFIFMLIWGDPGESGMMLFFIILVVLFWLTFITRFNYILHIKLRK